MNNDFNFPKGPMGHVERKRSKLVGMRRGNKRKNERKEINQDRALGQVYIVLPLCQRESEI